MLQQRITTDLNESLRRGDQLRRSVLGMVASAIHNKAIEKGKQKEGLKDEEVVEVLMSEAKKRRDAIQEYLKAEREETAKKEEKELAIIQEYLPQQLSQEEVRAELEKIVAGLGLAGKENLPVGQAGMGRVMGEAMKRLKGKADGAVVRSELEKLLGS